MENAKGRVVSLDDSNGGLCAIVDVDAAAVCARCAAGRGCGAGLLAGAGGARRVSAAVAADIELREGDEVELTLAPENLLNAALLVYGLPLLGGLAGAATALHLALPDPAAATVAVLGAATGYAVSRWRVRQQACLQRFTPTVTRLLAGSARPSS
jgi:sigma-E factor negative regulatory protein RseC